MVNHIAYTHLPSNYAWPFVELEVTAGMTWYSTVRGQWATFYTAHGTEEWLSGGEEVWSSSTSAVLLLASNAKWMNAFALLS